MRALEVLVVDDDPDMQLLVAEALGRAGHRVRCAGNGQQALRLLEDGLRPQLILLDIVMPVMDGIAFLRLKKTIDELQQIPVVVVSATAAAPIEGVRHVLHKPVDPDDVIAVVSAQALQPAVEE